MSIRVQLSCKHKVIAEGIAAVLRTHADIHLIGVTDEDLGTKILCELERPEVVVVVGVEGEDETVRSHQKVRFRVARHSRPLPGKAPRLA